jgi:hypothetical protein
VGSSWLDGVAAIKGLGRSSSAGASCGSDGRPVYRIAPGELATPRERVDWLAALGAFAEERCPHCGAAATLSASKNRLGCIDCLPGAAAATA